MVDVELEARAGTVWDARRFTLQCYVGAALFSVFFSLDLFRALLIKCVNIRYVVRYFIIRFHDKQWIVDVSLKQNAKSKHSRLHTVPQRFIVKMTHKSGGPFIESL